MFEAWQCGALSAGYMQKTLNELSRQMAEIESDDLVPPGWKATWDRYGTITAPVHSMPILCAT